MSLDLSEVLRKFDGLEAWADARARRGLQAVTAEAEGAMRGTLAHGDVTGATRAGYAAYVVSPEDSGAAALAAAVAAVEAKNPGHSATDGGQLAQGSLGVIFTCPTDYQRDLETEGAGKRAVLGPTMDAYRDELTARAARGS